MITNFVRNLKNAKIPNTKKLPVKLPQSYNHDGYEKNATINHSLSQTITISAPSNTSNKALCYK